MSIFHEVLREYQEFITVDVGSLGENQCIELLELFSLLGIERAQMK